MVVINLGDIWPWSPSHFPGAPLMGGAHTASERGLLSLLMSPSLHYCSDGTAGGGADREMDTATEGVGGAFKRREEWDWVDVGVVCFFSAQTQSQCGIISGGTQTKHILVHIHCAKCVCVCVCMCMHVCFMNNTDPHHPMNTKPALRHI